MYRFPIPLLAILVLSSISCKKDDLNDIDPDHFEHYHFVLDAQKRPLEITHSRDGSSGQISVSLYDQGPYPDRNDTLLCDSTQCVIQETRYIYDGNRLARVTQNIFRNYSNGRKELSGPNYATTYSYHNQNVTRIETSVDQTSPTYRNYTFTDNTAMVNTNPLFGATGTHLISSVSSGGAGYRHSSSLLYRYEFDENSYVTRIYRSSGTEENSTITQIDITYAH